MMKFRTKNSIWSGACDTEYKLTAEQAFWHASTNTPIDIDSGELGELIRRAVACQRRYTLLREKTRLLTWREMEVLRRLSNAAHNYGAMAANRIAYGL